jgi:dienelactone hydrolase
MLAKLGYVALALDMFGDGKHTQHPKDAKKFAMGIYKNLKVGEERFLAAKKELEAHPMVDTKKLAAIGYCFGGGIVLHMARTGVKLAGVASFHGGLKANHKAKKGDIKADILVLNGAADPMVPAKDIKAFHKEMKRLGAKFKFINYPDALHAFTNPEATAKGKQFKLPVAYNKKADEQSWTELQAFFKRIF